MDETPENNDEPREQLEAEAKQFAQMAKDFFERSSDELGVYAAAEPAIQRDPNSGDWLLQAVVSFGDRAYKAIGTDDTAEIDAALQDMEYGEMLEHLARRMEERGENEDG